MTYAVKEVFLTLQGEGANTGRRAVFVRFAGCNLWSGREKDRAAAVCKFCDTNFVGGKKYSLASLCAKIAEISGIGALIVLTGGEPALQVDGALVAALHNMGCEVAVETNGTIPLPSDIDWVCLSPKAGTRIILTHCDELKVVFPQVVSPLDYSVITAKIRWVSPMDGPNLEANTTAAIRFCLDHPEWRLNSQSHKQWGIR